MQIRQAPPGSQKKMRPYLQMKVDIKQRQNSERVDMKITRFIKIPKGDKITVLDTLKIWIQMIIHELGILATIYYGASQLLYNRIYDNIRKCLDYTSKYKNDVK